MAAVYTREPCGPSEMSARLHRSQIRARAVRAVRAVKEIPDRAVVRSRLSSRAAATRSSLWLGASQARFVRSAFGGGEKILPIVSRCYFRSRMIGGALMLRA